jgi:uncharacterized membrane protein YagU involved in acid resistance
MRSRIVSGAIAGLLAGVVFGIMMTMMKAPTPDGMEIPMMTMVAMVVRSTSLIVGWIYHLFNSALIGALFGVVLGGRVEGKFSSGLVIGALYGIVWWVLGALILMPVLLGMPAFAPLQMPPMRPVAMGSLVGHIIFGVLLGLEFVRRQAKEATVMSTVRAPSR